jgi:K+-transporting ATPase ATPase A chain
VTRDNGSACAGITVSTASYNVITTFGLLLGRFVVIVPVLARAGALAARGNGARLGRTFRTDRPMFTGLLVGVILSVGALTFFPPSRSVRLPNGCLTGGSSDVRVV